jgi:hypothetical protein
LAFFTPVLSVFMAGRLRAAGLPDGTARLACGAIASLLRGLGELLAGIGDLVGHLTG